MICEIIKNITIGLLISSISIGLITFILAHLFLKGPIDFVKSEFAKIIYKIRNSTIKKRTVNSFFHIRRGENKTDLVAYQFGLRPNLPIIDILYLELLKSNHKNNRIEKIVIFPTIDKSITKQTEYELELFKNNLNKVFCHDETCFEIVNPFRDSSLTSKELIEEKFIDTLSYLGHKNFYSQVKSISKYKIKGIQDFNKYHGKDKLIMTLITHVFKAWEVREYILEYIKNSNKEKMNIGFIFWEVEFDKWGIFDRTSKNDEIQEVALFIGKSIYGKENIFSRYKPIPVFTNDALGVFDEKHEILEKITKHSNKQVKILNSILTAILHDNYDEVFTKRDLMSQSIEFIDSLNTSDNQFISSYNNINGKISKNQKMLFTLIIKLRSKYGC